MASTAQKLRNALIRNFETSEKTLERRDPLYETLCARLARGTAASKPGISIDVVAPGKRACPYHFHHAQEEMFVVLEGGGTLRVADEMLPLVSGDVVFIPPGPQYPHQIINDSDAPLKYLSISTKESPEIVQYPDSGSCSPAPPATAICMALRACTATATTSTIGRANLDLAFHAGQRCFRGKRATRGLHIGETT